MHEGVSIFEVGWKNVDMVKTQQRKFENLRFAYVTSLFYASDLCSDKQANYSIDLFSPHHLTPRPSTKIASHHQQRRPNLRARPEITLTRFRHAEEQGKGTLVLFYANTSIGPNADAPSNRVVRTVVEARTRTTMRSESWFSKRMARNTRK